MLITNYPHHNWRMICTYSINAIAFHSDFLRAALLGSSRVYTHLMTAWLTITMAQSVAKLVPVSHSPPLPTPPLHCTPHASWHLNCSRKLCQECWAPVGIVSVAVSVAVATASNELLAATAATTTTLLATLKSMQFSYLPLSLFFSLSLSLSAVCGMCFVYRNETFERGELSRPIAPTTVSDWIGEPCRAIDQLLLLLCFFHFHFLLFIFIFMYGVHPIVAHVLRPSLTQLNLTI